MRLVVPRLVVVAFVCVACGEGEEGVPPAPQAPVPGIVIDSILPIEEEIRRFAENAGPVVQELGGSFTSRDELIAAFVRALEARDTVALREALVTSSEFIHLYFPHTVYTGPPYQMDPAFIWFQMNNLTSRGLTRAFNRFAGRDLGFAGSDCPGEPRREGPNRIWENCLLRLAGEDGTFEIELFGPIIERNERFKFLTYANEL